MANAQVEFNNADRTISSTVQHSLRTAVAAVVSLVVARLFGLPEAYWAAVTTLVIMQSTVGAALTASGQRIAGTAVGAVMSATLGHFFPSSLLVFGSGVFLLGILYAALRIDRTAYRFAGITLAIVLLIGRAQPPWLVATHRFVEVGIGIAVGLGLTWVWPE